MDLVFYKSTSDTYVADKVLTDPLTITGELKEGCSILQPSITLAYNAALLQGYNICYIADFGRYYFVGQPVIDGRLIRISMEEDYLLSHKTGIKGCIGHIIRSRNGNKYIPDGMATQTSKTNWQWRSLGTCFTPSDDYVMIKGGIES